MRILRVVFTLKHPGLCRQVFIAIGFTDIRITGGARLVRNTQRVGTHIGDETGNPFAGHVHAFVQLLCGTHGAVGGKTEFAVGLLLHGGGDKRRGGSDLPFAGFYRRGGKGSPLKLRQNSIGGRLILDLDLALLVAVQTGREGLPFFGQGQLRIHRPVFLPDKGIYLLFTVHHQTDGRRLHPTGGKTLTDAFPQERTQLIAHDTVENTARLLSVHQVHIQHPRFRHAGGHRISGDLVKGDAVGRGGIHFEELR